MSLGMPTLQPQPQQQQQQQVNQSTGSDNKELDAAEDLIQELLILIPSLQYRAYGPNLLLPYDASQDIPQLLPPILRDIRSLLQRLWTEPSVSFALASLFSVNFQTLLDLKCYFPDVLLGKLLSFCQHLVFGVVRLPYTVKFAIGQVLSSLLHKAKRIDRALFQCAWRPVYKFIDSFLTPMKQNRLIFHSFEMETYGDFVELPKHLRHFFPDEAFDEIWAEFESDIDRLYAGDMIRALRYLALLLPMDRLSSIQFGRILKLVEPSGPLCTARRLSSEIDLTVVFLLERATKWNEAQWKSVNLSPFVSYILDTILPAALKLPSPVRGLRKLTKLLSKEDGAMGKSVFEALGSDLSEHVAKLLVNVMPALDFKTSILPSIRFSLLSLRNLSHPSNYGGWTAAIDNFLLKYSGALSKRLSTDAEFRATVNQDAIDQLTGDIWGLCERLLFSKGGVSSSSGSFVTCLTCKYLANVSPGLIASNIVELSGTCLDSLTEPHRTAAAIGLISLGMPSLLNASKTDVAFAPVLAALPLVIQGIDSNDQMKSIFAMTLIANFSDCGRVVDVSEMAFEEGVVPESSQAAKELTGQFPDVAILFTEQLIEYLRALPESHSKAEGMDDYVCKLIISVARSFYPQLTEPIARMCLEKWLVFFENDAGPSAAEVIGDVLGSLAESHGKIISEAVVRTCLQRFERASRNGAGKLGATDQYNRSLSSTIILLTVFLQYGHAEIQAHFDDISAVLLGLLESVEQRKLVMGLFKLNFSLIWLMAHPYVREKSLLPNAKDNPFKEWGQWRTFEGLKAANLHYWVMQAEPQYRKALNWLQTVTKWTEKQLAGLGGLSVYSSLETERVASLVLSLEALVLGYQLVLGLVGETGLNFQCNSPSALLAKEARDGLLKASSLLLDMDPLLVRLNNVEITKMYLECVGGLVNFRGQDPNSLKKLINAIDSLSVNYIRHPQDRGRPNRILLRKTFSFFKLRLNMRHVIGDDETGAFLKDSHQKLLGVLERFVTSHYKDLRRPSHRFLQQYYLRHLDEMRPFIKRQFQRVRDSVDLNDEELEGYVMLLRDELLDVIADDSELFDEFCRLLIHLNNSQPVKKLKEGVKHLASSMNALMKSYVRSELQDQKRLAALVQSLVDESCREDASWTTQTLALNAVHSLMDESSVREEHLLPLLALCTGKNVQVRSWAQEAFTLAVDYYRKQSGDGKMDSEDWRQIRSKHISRAEFSHDSAGLLDAKLDASRFDQDSVLSILCGYLAWQQLDDGEGTCQLRHGQVDFISHAVQLLQEKPRAKLLIMLEEELIRGKAAKKSDNGAQRALAEWVGGIWRCRAADGALSLFEQSFQLMTWECIGLWESMLGKLFDCRDSRLNLPLLSKLQERFSHILQSMTDGPQLTCALRLFWTMFRAYRSAGMWLDGLPSTAALIGLFGHDFSAVGIEAGRFLALFTLHQIDQDALTSALIAAVPDVKNPVYPAYCRSLLHFLAALSTLPGMTGYWCYLSALFPVIVAILASENHQLLEDCKRALVTLFMPKGVQKDEFLGLFERLGTHVTDGSGTCPAKTRKYLCDLMLHFLQNNYSILQDRSLVDALLTDGAIGKLNGSSLVDVREASLGMHIICYQLNPALRDDSALKLCRTLEADRFIFSIKQESMLSERHSTIVKTCAMALSEPYSIPAALPRLLSALSRYVSDRYPIAPMVRDTFSDFRRTHLDTWAQDRQLFTESQLDAIGELLIAPSYYA